MDEVYVCIFTDYLLVLGLLTWVILACFGFCYACH